MRFFNKHHFSLLLILLLLLSGNNHAKTFVLFTVDVESYSNGNPDAQIWGRFDGIEEEWGITKIMDILDSHGTKGTFYLNVYESAAHGALPIRLAANAIHEQGHDLQLHTHPQPMFGVSVMSKASYEKQVEILSKGIELIHNWTGKPVIAHRAGAFEANLNTVKAVKDSGLSIDSSLGFGSSLAEDIPLSNTVSSIEGVIQLPLTHYNQVKIGNWESKRHVDIEGSTYRELKEILEQATDNGLCSVNILMHSFSLSRYGAPDPDVAERLGRILEYINNNNNLTATTTSDFYKLLQQENICVNEKDFTPTTGLFLTYLRAVEDFDKGHKNIIVAIGTPVVLFLLILFFTFITLRRIRSKSH